jgi:NAD(P)-dependent dehydrogenase (short-subunit alcohol dehydrogenase family)
MAQHASSDPRIKGPKPPFSAGPQAPPGSDAQLRPRADHGEDSYVGRGLLEGRAALITGGDSGIGRAVALAFAREGADIAFSYLAGREEADAEATEALVRQAGRRVVSCGTDLATDAACEDLVRRALRDLGRIDVLVNNAAFQGKAVERFEDMDAERIQHTFAVNILAMFHLTRHALAHMQAGGVIINTTSIQAFEPSRSILDYATTKAAIVAFTKGLADELVERGIRVNAIAPGPVWTPLVAQSFGEEKIREFGSNNPMQRPAQPAELAPAFVFLASDQSRFVTGETLAVTGGRSIQ